MAGSVNKVILIWEPWGRSRNSADPGRPGRSPTCALRLQKPGATRIPASARKRPSGNRVVIFNEGLCKVAEQYLKKGAKVYIEGALQTRKWNDQSGAEKFSTEVVLQGFNSVLTMLDGRSGAGGGFSDDAGGDFGSGGPSMGAPRRAAVSGGGGGGGGGGRGGSDMDDEIPF